MSRMSRALAVFIVAFAVAAAMILQRRSGANRGCHYEQADWESFGYQLRPVRAAAQFNFTVRFRTVAKPARFRALVNCQDAANYYYVQVADGQVRLGRVEQQFDLRIGTRKRVDVDDGKQHELVIARREGDLVVALDGQLAAWAFDDTFADGQIGLGALAQSVQFAGARVQPVSDVFFTDDFMRAEGDAGPWNIESGKWRICTIDNPSLSSNAFYYVGKAAATATATAVAGNWFWDNYRARAACRPSSNDAVGLYFCYRDAANHFLFKWDNAPKSPTMQVIRTREGKSQVMAQGTGGFLPGQWYELRADVSDGHAQLFVDGNPMLSVADSALCFGKVGLYTEDAGSGTDFDDVSVQRCYAFQDDFESVCAAKWAELGGDWKYAAPSAKRESRRLVASSASAAKAVAGLDQWRDYTFAVDMGPWGEGAAGVCFYYLDEGNYYASRWRRVGGKEVAELLCVKDGHERILAQRDAPLGNKRSRRVAVSADDGHLQVAVDGATVLEGFDASLPGGKVGLYVSKCPFAWFDNARVTFHAPVEPLESVHEAFSHERSMQIWSGAESDWESRCRNIGDLSIPFEWHRAKFYGDVDMVLRAGAFSGETQVVGLVVAADTTSYKSGCRLHLAKKDDGWRAALWDRDTEVASKPLPHAPRQLRLRKVGRFVAGYVDGECIFQHQPKSPLTGAKIAYYVRGAEVKREDVHVRTTQVYNDLFRRAPSDWRVACGTWEVTNRWQCDPRWSFFSGRSKRLAAIWNKQMFPADIAVEFYAGIKMDRDRGRHYEYASDINVTLCADGRDLNTGYSFLFGGWKNRATAIVRKGKIVARTRQHNIPNRTNIHRRWFYIRVERKGPELSYYIDNERVLAFTDEHPLTGGYVGIWTYDNGIMVSRVRISYAGNAPQEKPFPGPLPATGCVYDRIPKLKR